MLMDGGKLLGLHLRWQSIAIRLVILRQISEEVLPAERAFMEGSDCAQAVVEGGDVE